MNNPESKIQRIEKELDELSDSKVERSEFVKMYMGLVRDIKNAQIFAQKHGSFCLLTHVEQLTEKTCAKYLDLRMESFMKSLEDSHSCNKPTISLKIVSSLKYSKY